MIVKMNKIIKIIRKNRVICISVIICIFSVLYIVLVKKSEPHLEINGQTMSFNESKVYIDGAVQNPGTYIFKNGQTLQDIINAAGGLKENADLNSIDFKYNIKNGEKIIIEYIKEDLYDDENTDTEVININTASKEELMTLDGIGEKMAQNIIEYRNKAEFEVIEDLMNVEGIGEKKFSNIKEKIVVE